MPKIKIMTILFILISFSLLLTPVALAQDGLKYRALTEWEYHWGDLSNYEHDNLWKDITTLTSGKIPQGVVTIWFKIKLPENHWTNPAVYYQRIYAKSLEIYLDHQKIVTKKHLTFYNTNIFIAPLNRDFNGKTLYIHINQPERPDSTLGQVPKVFIGDFEYLLRRFLKENYTDLIFGCFFILLAMAMFLSSVFLKTAQKKIWVTLSFIWFFFGVQWAIFPNHIGTFFPEFEKQLMFLVIITISMLPVLLIYFFEQIFGPGRRFMLRRLWQIQLVVSIFCIGTSLVNMLSHYQFNTFDCLISNSLMGILYILLLVIMVLVAIYYAFKGNVDAKVFTAGFSVFAIFFIFDLIISLYSFDSFTLFKFGELIMFVSLIFILGRRVAYNYKQVVIYSKELEIKNQELDTIGKEVEKSRDQLIELNKTLELRVSERTEQLSKANEELQDVNEELSTANEHLVSTLGMLTKTQNQLIESEKMAALGQLVAGVAHEINSPLGAIGASIENMLEFLNDILQKLAPFYRTLTPESLADLNYLLKTSFSNRQEYTSTSDERKYRNDWSAFLATHSIPNPETYADMLVTMGIYHIEPQFSFLNNEAGIQILEMAFKLSGLYNTAKTIQMAVERTTKVVFALKSYAHFDSSSELVEVDIQNGVETVLTLYHNKFKHGVEVIRNYEAINPIRCYPDELNQIWTNIIHNALQAMDYKGKMIIDIFRDGNYVVVAVTDSGAGIPEDIRDKIFNPFFTTKPQGEGSGLGLHLVREIVEKHQGKIEVESQPGLTTFRIFIPGNL